eukprot:388753-Pyramimonas_sp.AAC.1
MSRQRLSWRSAVDLGDLDRDRWFIVDLEQVCYLGELEILSRQMASELVVRFALRVLGVCTSLHPRAVA